jgi:hypothetical protein
MTALPSFVPKYAFRCRRDLARMVLPSKWAASVIQLAGEHFAGVGVICNCIWLEKLGR